jgi:hypothetical protein
MMKNDSLHLSLSNHPNNSAMSLFQLANGASAHLLSAKDLVAIPVWKNNRIIDHAHVADIAKHANPRHLDHGYHVGILAEEDASGRPVDQPYIIDGQHRITVLRKYFEDTLCAEDFHVLVFERRFTTEGELIEYFNNLNKAKPVQPWVDENLVLNQCIRAIEDAFDNRKARLIRPGGCHRPYLSADRLRDALKALGLSNLPNTAQGAEALARRIKDWNDAAIRNDLYTLGIRSIQKRGFFEKGAKVGFVLAHDDRFMWLKDMLKNK